MTKVEPIFLQEFESICIQDWDCTEACESASVYGLGRLYPLSLIMSKTFMLIKKHVCQPYWSLYYCDSFENLQAWCWELLTRIGRNVLLKLHWNGLSHPLFQNCTSNKIQNFYCLARSRVFRFYWTKIFEIQCEEIGLSVIWAVRFTKYAWILLSILPGIFQSVHYRMAFCKDDF